MKDVLVLGAGHSAPFLIHDLLKHAEAGGYRVTVGDREEGAAVDRVAGHPRGRGIRFDAGDADGRRRRIAEADVVVNLLPPPLQPAIAADCVDCGVSMLSASYRSPQVAGLEAAAAARGVLLLCELGLDPGIDVMAAQELIDRIQRQGGEVRRFLSYGGGLPDPAFDGNPLRYCITWNPRNVVMAAEHGAVYLRHGRLRLVPWHDVFATTWRIEVPGIGALDAYPNRDSLSYREVHGLDGATSVVRATLRYPGFCQTWHQLVRLGMPNEALEIPDLAERSYAELVEMFLPAGQGSIEERVAAHLGLDRDDEVFRALDWLGLFSDRPIGGAVRTPAAALVALLRARLPLPAGQRDVVVLHHEVEAVWAEARSRRRFRASFVHYGEAGGFTAMARGVGLPLALGTRLVLAGELPLVGVHRPTRREVYEPILGALETAGMAFAETDEGLPWGVDGG